MSRTRSLASVLASPRDTWLAARTLGWLCILPVLKRAVGLERLVRLMWRQPRGDPPDSDREQRTVRIVARLSRSSGQNCLERSLVLYRILARANADPRLVVGMAKPDEYLGHVWVVVQGRTLLESPETLSSYTEVVRFGHGGAREWTREVTTGER